MWKCYDDGFVTGKYNVSSDVLDTRFNFNYTNYAGRYSKINLFCDEDLEITHHLLKAYWKHICIRNFFFIMNKHVYGRLKLPFRLISKSMTPALFTKKNSYISDSNQFILFIDSNF